MTGPAPELSGVVVGGVRVIETLRRNRRDSALMPPIATQTDATTRLPRCWVDALVVIGL